MHNPSNGRLDITKRFNPTIIYINQQQAVKFKLRLFLSYRRVRWTPRVADDAVTCIAIGIATLSRACCARAAGMHETDDARVARTRIGTSSERGRMPDSMGVHATSTA